MADCFNPYFLTGALKLIEWVPIEVIQLLKLKIQSNLAQSLPFPHGPVNQRPFEIDLPL